MGSELNISPGVGRYYRKAFANEIWGLIFVMAYFPGVLLEFYGISFYTFFI